MPGLKITCGKGTKDEKIIIVDLGDLILGAVLREIFRPWMLYFETRGRGLSGAEAESISSATTKDPDAG
jgi:hypothetical protein